METPDNEIQKAATAEAPANASPATAAKAPAASASETKSDEAAPAVIAPGVFGSALAQANLAVENLGSDATGIEMLRASSDNLHQVAEFLKNKQSFDLLMSCTGIDWKDRLESIYLLYSTTKHVYLQLRVNAVDEHSPSLYPVWNAADWHERETYDLVGIKYDGHPNLVRILMPDDWLGHPLRKDYKVNDPRLVWNER
jgi:NADH-quinone oxidoreductase subunit C